MPALEQRQPPPLRGHAARLRASIRRNLSQFELDDADMQDAPGDIEEDVLGGRGRGRPQTPRGRPGSRGGARCFKRGSSVEGPLGSARGVLLCMYMHSYEI
jgi:hypothetical protein